MSGLLSNIDRRTKLAGQNRLELLLFNLGSEQKYGINVFKVKEIVEYMPLTFIPNTHPVVRGIVNMRGKTFPVFDLNYAIGGIRIDDLSKSYIIITEYNKNVQGFLVDSVDRIINLDWEDMHKLPFGAGEDNFLTAVTNVDNKLVEIIDVEKILQEVSPVGIELKEKSHKDKVVQLTKGKQVLICDDSLVARNQLAGLLRDIGFEVIVRENGREALTYLEDLVVDKKTFPKELVLVISDIEMPDVDGYKLTKEIRANEKLKDLHVILHSSLSGVFNTSLVSKVGANKFIAKFDPNDIVQYILDKAHEFIIH